jgi:hypothetical protein
MQDMYEFECGHAPENVVDSPTAMDILQTMRHAGWIAVSATVEADSATSSIALVDECKMLWLKNSPYSARGLLIDDAVVKVCFGDDRIPGVCQLDLAEEIAREMSCPAPRNLRKAEELLRCDSPALRAEHTMCPQCRAAVVHRLYAALRSRK